ncbi:MAG: nicotinate-nucleotide--dimethylbenzimidazole phosphoribosyltransferase [Cytophagales bacterium]|nr:MAG: nicotinate-nucleotide--dimethylbenzimidazole phosphoribosyltransferase [Cytophagales bacterium]TAF59910.1 MAG: nicotinate-nucleotide--dimethylbenzimidazole phosphoribosyltransferase [Cytophagales bacterium]
MSLKITPRSTALRVAIQHKINTKTKPLGALGVLESLALQIAEIQNSLNPRLIQPHVLVFAADHGLVDEGVSLYPQAVTAQMVQNFIHGGAAINVFCKQHNITLRVVDAGVNADLSQYKTEILHQKINYGTKNSLKEAAMSATECVRALDAGADVVNKVAKTGCNVIGFGEMGIGNTAAASLIMAKITKLPLATCVGRGTGLNDSQLVQKNKVLEAVLAQHTSATSPHEILMSVGGFEIAQLCGAMLKAAELGMCLVIDGFICTSALLLAYTLEPNVLDYCIFSHCSEENGHQAMLQFLGVEPVLRLGLRLGEGSAAALAYPLLESAVLFLNDMASFESAGVSEANV